MLEIKNTNELFLIDEMVADREFAQRFNESAYSEAMVNYYKNENLIWADML